MKKLAFALGAAGVAASAFAIHQHRSSFAADHRDAASLGASDGAIAADINDVYAFLSGDSGENLVLAMTVSPGVFADDVPFSTDVQYVFHINQFDNPLSTAAGEYTIICEFNSQTAIQCWLGDDTYIAGDASNPAAPLTSGGISIFAGVRSDPFFFNLSGFQATVGFVKDNAGGLTFDASGCPAIDAGTSSMLVGLLNDEGNATDEFIAANTRAIVIELPKTLVNNSHPYIGVWASTNTAN